MHSDDKTTIAQLKEKLRAFDHERDWEQFHDPKELAIALSVEAAEILDHFRFKRGEEIQAFVEKNRETIAHEIADCMSALARFADACNIDISKAFHEKLELTAKKYPIEKFKSRSEKYNEF